MILEIGDLVMYRTDPEAKPTHVGVVLRVERDGTAGWGLFAVYGKAFESAAWVYASTLEKVGTITDFGVTGAELRRIYDLRSR